MSVFAGSYLFVDLSRRSWERREIGADTLAAYLGGRGLGARLLFEAGRHRNDPLDPATPLIVSAGALAGTAAPAASRTSLTGLSPLTDTVFDANSGGWIGARLRAAGYDALWVEGRSEKPVVLVVEAGGARFEDASALSGLGNRAARAALLAKHGGKAALLTVGPAGERGALIANVANGERFFGRGGLGASFGAKNLKAVVALGEGKPTPADPEGFAFIVNECRKLLDSHPITSKGLPQFGTSVLMNVMNLTGVLPSRNFRTAGFDRAEEISGEALRDRLVTGRHGCPGCPIACGRRVTVAGVEMEGPEFETLWSLGADLGIADIEGVARLNALANDLGLDTVSAGSTVAAARELFEAGKLSWDPLAGGVEGVAELLREMASGQGNGALLRDGSLRLGRNCGAPEVSMTSKGLELPAYDPRGCQGQGLAYATSNRGGCHLRAYMIAPEVLATPKLVDRFAHAGKAGLVIVSQNLNAAVDSLGMCRFTTFALKDDYFARLLRAAAGIETDGQGFMTVGERIYTLERLMNLDRGFTRSDDALPPRLTDVPLADGPTAGRTVALEAMLEEYYRFRGWDREGRPGPKKIAALGLTEPGKGEARHG